MTQEPQQPGADSQPCKEAVADLRIASQAICRIGAALCGPAVSDWVAPAVEGWYAVSVPLPEPDELARLLARPRPVRWVQPALFEAVAS